LGKIDSNYEAQPLKMLVARNLNFQACSQLKDENSNKTQRESLEKADVSIYTTMCVEESVDHKVLKDTMLEEVQRIKLLMHSHVICGRDTNREPPSAFAILRMIHQ
jgi:hypothetical protein